MQSVEEKVTDLSSVDPKMVTFKGKWELIVRAEPKEQKYSLSVLFIFYIVPLDLLLRVNTVIWSPEEKNRL